MYFLIVEYVKRWIQGRARNAPHLAPYFLHSLSFFNHFEEIKTVLFQAQLIISHLPLTYDYPNSLETCLTSNHLLFGRQLLYSLRRGYFVATAQHSLVVVSVPRNIYRSMLVRQYQGILCQRCPLVEVLTLDR